MPESCADRLIVLDRGIDLVTPLLTQLTYGGLVDEILGGTEAASQMVYDEPILDLKSERPVRIHFDSSDYLWMEMRDMSFSAAEEHLKEKCVEHIQVRNNFQANKDTGLKLVEIKETYRRIATEDPLLRSHQLLQGKIHEALFQESPLHTHYMRSINMEQGLYRLRYYLDNREEIVDQIEQIIDQDVDGSQMDRALRLICLASVTSDGLRSDDLDHLRTSLLQCYGYEKLFQLQALESVGMLALSTHRFGLSGTVFDKDKAALKLLVETETAAELQDNNLAYTYLWYCPATVRIAERALGLGDPQATAWDSTQVLNAPGVDCGTAPSAEAAARRDTKRIIVAFLGGCTRCEVAALRLLGEKACISITVVTTALLTGDTLVDVFGDQEGQGFAADGETRSPMASPAAPAP